MGRARYAYVLAAVAAFAGCDSRAKASDPVGLRPESKSKEYESCAASMHCQDDLRCFDHVCRRSARSTVGDYYAALGAQQRSRGDFEAAIDSYNKALGHYDSEKIALPPDVDCQYGIALSAAKAKKEHAELAARVLHRCVLAVPVGSSLRDRALQELATLTDSGLDPLALGRTQLADVYLTRAPSAPATDKLQVTLSTNPSVDSKKTYPVIPERLAQPDVRSALVACWEGYNKATKKASMSVSIPLKVSYIASEYEDEPGKFVTKIDAAAGGPAGPDTDAENCARATIEPALKSLTTIRDAFSTSLTITVK